MDIFSSSAFARRSIALLALSTSIQLGNAIAQDPPARSVLKLSEVEQRGFVSSYLNRGMPSGSGGDALAMLILNRSSATLPIIERKIEDVLTSTDPSSLFSDPNVDPKIFVATAGSAIAYAGDLESLKAIATLIKLDRRRFAPLVSETLNSALNLRNAMSVAYAGVDQANPDLGPLISAWLSKALSAPSSPYVEQRQLAEAMLDRYGGIPSESQWNTDPIVSHIPSERARAIHDRVMQLAVDAQAKRRAAGK